MFKIDIKEDINAFSDRLTKAIKKDIKVDVIQNGMDKQLDKSLSQLKTQLLDYINKEVKEQSQIENKGVTKDEIDVPKSDEDLMKHLFGIDISKINKQKDYTTSVQSNVFMIKDGRIRLRLPEGPDGNMEQSYQRALSHFRNAVFVDTTSPQPKYFLNTQFDPTPFVKIVCSRDAGVTDKGKKTYDSYLNSNKRTRHNDSELGRFSEWTMFKDGVDKLIRESTNITDILESVKNGEYERAIENFKRLNRTGSSLQVEQKLEDLKDNKNLAPNIEAHRNLVTLIKNLKISKRIEKEQTVYSVVSSFSEEGDGFDKFYDEIKQRISLWVITNDSVWFKHLINVIKATIEKTLKGLK